MPNYFEIAEEAAASITESKFGMRLFQESASLARHLLGEESSLARVFERKTEPVLSGLASNGTRSLQAIIRAFPEPIPETLANLSEAPSNSAKISSILTPKVDRNLGIGFRRLSEGWSKLPEFPGTKLGVQSASGELAMPEVLLSIEEPGQGAMASWVNGKIYMGREVFRKAFSAETAGIAVHETTHHEQGFLAVCRKSDQLGIGCLSGDSEQMQSLMSAVKPYRMGLTDDTVRRFMELRAGRQLTSEASARAEKILSSNQELFDLPFSPQTIKRQSNEINGYRTLLSKALNESQAPSVLEQFGNPEKQGAIFQNIFGKEANVQQYKLAPEIQSGLRRGELAKVFENTLSRAEEMTELKKKTWMAVYQNALHEREARYNQFIAQQSVADYLIPK
jgi:hypothetical protein